MSEIDNGKNIEKLLQIRLLDFLFIIPHFQEYCLLFRNIYFKE